MYFDSAYIAKYYVNEPDAVAVRQLIRSAPHVCSCAWATVEVVCAFHRHVRERNLTATQGRELIDLFLTHVEADLWHLIPITSRLLRRTTALVRGQAPEVSVRAGDAIHLAAALEAGEAELCTNDRQLLAAAKYIGLTGRSISR